MSIDFPNSPATNDTYTVGSRTWTWTGTIWELKAAPIPANSVGTAELADNSVTTAKIAAGAVVEADIASNAVTTVKIADANITAAKLASSLPRGVVAYVRQESGTQSGNSMFGVIIGLNTFTTTFTPVAGRLYRCTYSIGNITQPSSPGAIIINLLKETSSTLDISNLFESTTNIVSHTRVITLTSSQLGTSSTYLGLSAQTDTSVTVTPSSARPTIIIVEDIGLA
jgi:hypothetical protein